MPRARFVSALDARCVRSVRELIGDARSVNDAGTCRRAAAACRWRRPVRIRAVGNICRTYRHRNAQREKKTAHLRQCDRQRHQFLFIRHSIPTIQEDRICSSQSLASPSGVRQALEGTMALQVTGSRTGPARGTAEVAARSEGGPAGGAARCCRLRLRQGPHSRVSRHVQRGKKSAMSRPA